MKRGSLVLFLVSILFISGCSPEMSPITREMEISEICNGEIHTFYEGDGYGDVHYNRFVDSQGNTYSIGVINIYETYATLSYQGQSMGIGCMDSTCINYGGDTKRFDWGSIRVLNYNDAPEPRRGNMQVCIQFSETIYPISIDESTNEDSFACIQRGGTPATWRSGPGYGECYTSSFVGYDGGSHSICIFNVEEAQTTFRINQNSFGLSETLNDNYPSWFSSNFMYFTVISYNPEQSSNYPYGYLKVCLEDSNPTQGCNCDTLDSTPECFGPLYNWPSSQLDCSCCSEIITPQGI